MAEQKGKILDCFECEYAEPELDPEDEGIISLYQGVERWGLSDAILKCYGFPAEASTINKLIAIDVEVKDFQKEQQKDDG